jgi:hypothetical protein
MKGETAGELGAAGDGYARATNASERDRPTLEAARLPAGSVDAIRSRAPSSI